ncbi:hypothetical protein IMZ29_22355, partial [Achromobacter sp. GG226]|nr:hypothetical protein [Verticiella sp. GG226]
RGARSTARRRYVDLAPDAGAADPSAFASAASVAVPLPGGTATPVAPITEASPTPPTVESVLSSEPAAASAPPIAATAPQPASAPATAFGTTPVIAPANSGPAHVAEATPAVPGAAVLEPANTLPAEPSPVSAPASHVAEAVPPVLARASAPVVAAPV